MILNKFGPSRKEGGQLYRGHVYQVRKYNSHEWIAEVWLPHWFHYGVVTRDRKWKAENWCMDQIELFHKQRACGQSEAGHRYEEVDLYVGECIDCGRRIRT